MKSSNIKIYNSKTLKVYKNKKLSGANFGDFTLNDYQVFLHLISKIGGVDEFGKYLQPNQLQRDHILTAKEFSNIFGVDIHSCYRVLKRSVDKLMKTDIRIEKQEDSGYWRINVCSMAEYNKNDGSITIQFTDSIMPYLAQVKQRFVLYNLKEISNFGSIYTTRLYEALQEFKETGWMLKSVDQLREIFAVGSKFKLYGHLKKNTFAHACREINDNYDMDLTFEEEKEGRKVVAVKFRFKQTVVSQVVNEKTGKVTSIYEKPKAIALKKTKEVIDKYKKSSNTIEEQMSLDDSKSGLKPVKNIMLSLLDKFLSQK